MDTIIAVVTLVAFAAPFLAIGLYLDAHQHSSRAIPVIRQVYPRARNHRFR